jgi:hypothetical protein
MNLTTCITYHVEQWGAQIGHLDGCRFPYTFIFLSWHHDQLGPTCIFWLDFTKLPIPHCCMLRPRLAYAPWKIY